MVKNEIPLCSLMLVYATMQKGLVADYIIQKNML